VSNEHADSFSITPGVTSSSTAEGARQGQTSSDNEAAAARALAERERTFTTGGGTEPGATPVQSTAWVEATIARVRLADRPSPFGTTHFPPIPAPKSRTAKP
jgi:hypothetical protein